MVDELLQLLPCSLQTQQLLAVPASEISTTHISLLLAIFCDVQFIVRNTSIDRGIYVANALSMADEDDPPWLSPHEPGSPSIIQPATHERSL